MSITVKDGAKIALGFILVKGIAVTAGAVVAAYIKVRQERQTIDAQDEAEAGVRAFQLNDDAPFGPIQSIDLRELFSRIADASSVGDCGDPECFIHGKRDEPIPLRPTDSTDD